MNIIENDLIIKIAILLFFLMSILILNIYYFVRRNSNFFLTLTHIVSFFLVIFLFASIMELSIIGLEIRGYYTKLKEYSLALGIIFSGLFIIRNLFLKRNKFTIEFSPDLKLIFQSIEDLVLIFDYDGNFVNTNGIEKKPYSEIFLDKVHDVNDFKYCLLNSTEFYSRDLINEIFNNLNRKSEIEIKLLGSYEFYIVAFSPMYIDKINYMGTSVSFHNITAEKKIMKEIEKQNEILQNSNKKLIEYVNILSLLEAEKERLSILQNVQRDLLQKIEIVIKKIKNIQNSNVFDKEAFNIIGEELRDIFKSIRETVNNMTKS